MCLHLFHPCVLPLQQERGVFTDGQVHMRGLLACRGAWQLRVTQRAHCCKQMDRKSRLVVPASTCSNRKEHLRGAPPLGTTQRCCCMASEHLLLPHLCMRA